MECLVRCYTIISTGGKQNNLKEADLWGNGVALGKYHFVES